MLDELDETYALNRLAELCKVKPFALDSDVTTDETFDALIKELKSETEVNAAAVADILMPAAHTVDFYFGDELGRNKDKAFDFLYDLYEHGGCVNPSAAHGCDGYCYYAYRDGIPQKPVTLDVEAPLCFTPLVSGNRIASVDSGDIIVIDTLRRMCAYVSAYGGTAAAKPGDGKFLCCADSAVAHAKAAKTVSDGAVKVSLLDYPVPALAITGVAKNAVCREAARIIAAANSVPVTAAAAKVNGETAIFAIFASDPSDDIVKAADALTACGVFAAADYAPLLPVLEKGVALSTDLFEFKPIYSSIGGVKHGAKAAAALDAEVVKRFKAALGAAASATAEQAAAFAAQKPEETDGAKA